MSLLMMLGLLTASPPQTCEIQPSSPSAVPTYALLIGHAKAPDEYGLPELMAVQGDVVQMTQMFDGWGAERFVHLDVEDPSLQSYLTPRAPTLTSIEATVEEMKVKLQREVSARPQVYVYYSGHGQRTPKFGLVRSQLFLAPEPAAAGHPAHDGIIDSHVFLERIVRPIQEYATVHVIVDACQSYFLLEPRAVKVLQRTAKIHPGPDSHMVSVFTEKFPHVGAILATNGSQSTFERPDVGGLFSYAVRSAALGQADFNGDGRITYREIGATILQVMADQGGSGPPGIVGPSGREDEVFLDLRGRPLIPVCFDEGNRGRYELFDQSYRNFAVVHPSVLGTTKVYLPPHSTWAVRSQSDPKKPDSWYWIQARQGLFSQLNKQELKFRQKGKDKHFRGMMPRPLDRQVGLNTATAQAPSSYRPPYWAVGMSGTWRRTAGTSGPSQMDSTWGIAATGRLGTGRHQLLLGLEWSRGTGTVAAGEPRPHVTDITELSLGYERVLLEGRFELTSGVFASAGWWHQEVEGEGSYDALSMAGGLSLTAIMPLTTRNRMAAFFRVRGGARYLCTEGCGNGVVSPMVWSGVGLEWETPF